VHEALNFAAVQRLPAVFIIQNNQVALGTRFRQHHLADDFYGWGRAYGVTILEVDGNHVLDVYAACRLATVRCRAGEGPVFVAAETFRMGGHATHDVREARRTFDSSLFESWGRRDPIGVFEEYLATGPALAGGEESDPAACEALNRRMLENVERGVIAEVDQAADEALASRSGSMPDPEETKTDIYASPCEVLRKT
jgi:TPP-dependent pyruvate/acetoin dehydrogenase alpha subunit